jgi:hypothetical protein
MQCGAMPVLIPFRSPVKAAGDHRQPVYGIPVLKISAKVIPESADILNRRVCIYQRAKGI